MKYFAGTSSILIIKLICSVGDVATAGTSEHGACGSVRREERVRNQNYFFLQI